MSATSPSISRRSSKANLKLRFQGAASLGGSVASADSRGKPRTFPVWPEFNDSDVASEKWDSATKGKEKGKSPSPACFEDPEGRIELPSSIKVHEWKRPIDFLQGKIPVVLEDNEGDFDLLRPNEHLCHSELMRCIIGQITSLWNISASKVKSSTASSARNSATPEPGEDSLWRPWEHIYAMTKQPKGPNIPQYNQYGKYVVKLFWMGCWRKITVDDYMPFDGEGRLLLPALHEDYKLWPMILSKALIKIAAIDYNTSEAGCEFGDFFVIHCLTGWLPETIPLRYGHLQKVWNLLKDILPEWQREEEKIKERVVESETTVASAPSKKDRLESGAVKGDTSAGSAHKGGKGKEGSKKKDDKEKKSATEHDASEKIERQPETVVFASFSLPEESPARVSALKEMADASENLRKVGLSHLHPHPVLITKTRDKPLKPPPPPPVIPRWKLIRPKKKRTTPSDEPMPEPEPPRPDQWLEITSTFMNHRITPLPLDPNFVKSRTSPLMPKGSRPSTGVTLKGIDEDPDNKVEPPKEDGVFRAQHVTSSRRLSMKGLSPSRLEKRGPSGRISPSAQSHSSSAKEPEQERESLKSQSATIEVEQPDGRGSVSNDIHIDEAKQTSTDESSIESVSKTMWMDFEDFCKSFQTLVIFHKPATYTCNQSATEIKHSLITGAPSSGGTSSKKGSANINLTTSSTNVRGSALPREEERAPKYLYIDNIEPSDLVISFSVLPRWSGSESEVAKKISDKDSVTGASEIISVKDAGGSSVNSGLLIAEPYSWKSLVVGQPILRVRTTGTRAACLTLQPGRHVLRFFFDTPLGYSLSICSSVNFVYGEEEDVMKPLVEESRRFVHTATSIMQGIGKCIEALGDVQAWNTARRALHKAHMPYQARSKKELNEHYEIWHKAFYETMAQLMTDSKVPSLAFALRSFNVDLSPQTAECLQEPKESAEIHEAWSNRIPTDYELKAIRRIQRCWRGAQARRIRRSITKKDTIEHTTARDILNNAWHLVQQSGLESIGFKLLRCMLKKDPGLIEKYPFHKDEWNKISYADYAGTYEDQHPRTWFVMFRETFMVEEDMLCVPKLYCSLRTCSLRVIDNDTGVEILRVFQKVAPHVYRKNKRGYTFLCEARSLDAPIQGGKWRLRLIGSSSPLPQPVGGQVNHHFKIKDNFGYYLPNENNVILRYHVKTRSDMIGSIQFQTSKPDVYIKLQVLDHEVEIASTQGKGHCVIPAFYFLADERPEERAASRVSQQESQAIFNQPSKQAVSNKKRTSSAKSKDGKKVKDSGEIARGSFAKQETQSIASEDINIVPSIPHKYTIQAVVERDSWPLTESQWLHVQKLREQEKEEIKVYSVGENNEVIFRIDRPAEQVSMTNRKRHSIKSSLSPKTSLSKSTSSINRLDSQSTRCLLSSEYPRRNSRTKPALSTRLNWASQGAGGDLFSRSYPSLAKQERPGSPPRVAGSGGKASAAPDKGKKGKGGDKGGKDKKTQDKESGSRPQSQIIHDSSKASWMLNVIVDEEKADDMDVKKDIDRQEEIKALKRAWEAQQPGRAVKALQARLAYLEKHSKKVEKDSDKENEDESAKSEDVSDAGILETKDETLSLIPPRPPTPKIILDPLDLSPFYRPSLGENFETYYLDDDILVLKENMERDEVNQYEKERQGVLDWREKEKSDRLQLKINQIRTFQEMQNKLDDARAELRKPREAYRQALLEEERKKKEEEELKNAELAAAAEASSGNASPKGKKSAGKKKK